MNWKEHLFLGVVFEILFVTIMLLWKGWFMNVTPTFVFQFVIVIFVSPLFVDLDHHNSKLREVLTSVGLLIGLVGFLGSYFYYPLNILKDIGIVLACAAYFLSYVTTHRGLVHSVPVCVIYAVGVYILTQQLSFASLALIGSYAHLIGDKLPFKFW